MSDEVWHPDNCSACGHRYSHRDDCVLQDAGALSGHVCRLQDALEAERTRVAALRVVLSRLAAVTVDSFVTVDGATLRSLQLDARAVLAATLEDSA